MGLATPEMVRGGVIIPALMFLYSAGWIGWAGRSYLIRRKDCKKYGAKTPMQMEYIINAPLALTCMASGFAWPVLAWQDIVNGKMVRRDEDIHLWDLSDGIFACGTRDAHGPRNSNNYSVFENIHRFLST